MKYVDEYEYYVLLSTRFSFLGNNVDAKQGKVSSESYLAIKFALNVTNRVAGQSILLLCGAVEVMLL